MNNWRKAVSVVMISSLMLSGGAVAAWADEPQPAAVDNRYPAPLAGAMQVKVKSVLSEHSATGTRLAAVVKMYNVWGSAFRVPDFEVRVVTSTGAAYTLKPSADNPASIEPMSSVELSYMVQIDTADTVKPVDMVWIDVNKDVYPKVETLKLDVPVANLVWYGGQSGVSDLANVKAWTDTFRLPNMDSSIVYTPVALTKDYKEQTPVQLLKLLAENTGTLTETLPAFTMNGKSETQVFKGSRADQSVVSLDPGEKKYIYYAIPTELDTRLLSFTLMTPETYRYPNRTDAAAAVSYDIGRLSIQAPAADTLPTKPAVTYAYNTPIAFDPLSTFVNPDIAVAVADLEIYENKGQGYQTGILKLKLTNKTDKPVPVPQFATELSSAAGASYAGSRQATAASEVVPNTAYIVNYSFVLPLDTPANAYTLKLLDDKTAAPYKTPIAEGLVPVLQSEPSATKLSMYPFEVDIKDWTLTYMAAKNSLSGLYNYTYRLKANWEVKSTDAVIVDNQYSKLLMELEGRDGRKIASQIVNLTGADKIMTGEQTIYFTDTPTDQMDYPITLKFYEVIDTPAGQARKLVSTLVQQ